MRRTETLTEVPAAIKDQIVEDYMSEGATVEIIQTGATFTVIAKFENWQGSIKFLGLADGEEERPKRADLTESHGDSFSLYYPSAVRDLLGSMKTLGRYRDGYPRGAVVHFTAGRTDPRNDIRHAQQNGYCYFVIGPDGAVYQNFPLDRWGSHAGLSSWPGLGAGVSQYLVGIEICCAGFLADLGNGSYRPWYNEEKHLSKSGRKPDPRADFQSDQVRQVSKKDNRTAGYYHKFTELQEASLHVLLGWLKKNRPDVFSFDLVLGHDEVSPGRKVDPGGSLSETMSELRERLKRGW